MSHRHQSRVQIRMFKGDYHCVVYDSEKLETAPLPIPGRPCFKIRCGFQGARYVYPYSGGPDNLSESGRTWPDIKKGPSSGENRLGSKLYKYDPCLRKELNSSTAEQLLIKAWKESSPCVNSGWWKFEWVFFFFLSAFVFQLSGIKHIFL